MDRNDQQAIEQLFGKLADVERQAPTRDGEAEAFIRRRISEQPGAPYYMAQTIVVQEQALKAAQARIEELEAELAEAPRQSGGGLLGSLFGGGDQRPRRQGAVPSVGRPGTAMPRGPIPQAAQRTGGGGGFLAGAAQTAMGVAGGVLLANAIGGMLGGGMLGGGEAEAAEAEPADDAGGMDDGGGFDMGEF
jgi:hypothetical protein